MGRTGQVLALGALAVGLGLVLFLHGERGAAGTPAEPRTEVIRPKVATELAAADMVEGGPQAALASPPSRNQRERVSESLGAIERVRIAGRIAVEDVLGQLHEQESGRFDLHLPIRGLNAAMVVHVDRGLWSFELPRVAELDLDALTASGFVLGERVAFAQSPQLFLEASEENVLQVRWLPRLTVRARTWNGVDIDPFFLRLGEDVEDDALEIPDPPRLFGRTRAPAEFYLEDPARPFESKRPWDWEGSFRLLKSRVIYVGAEDHAWKRLVIEPVDRELVVQLEPGGALRVRFERGLSSAPGTWLRLRSNGAATGLPFCEMSLSQDCRLEGLPAGRFELLAELGSRAEPRVLARATVEVVAGVTREVFLETDAASTPVEIEGTLDLPHAWRLDDFELVITLASTHAAGLPAEITIPRKGMTVRVPGSPIRNWRRTLIPGSYLALVPAAKYTQPFEVEPWTRSIALIVPPP